MASNDKTLDLAITQIEKQYGKGSIMKLNEEVVVECNGISTGSISLDAAVGIGGVPRGRIVEIYHMRQLNCRGSFFHKLRELLYQIRYKYYP